MDRCGESRLAWAECYGGKRLPSVPKPIWDMVQIEVLPLQELLHCDLAFDRPGDFTDQALAYMLFFRAGPRKYRKAFEAYVDELVETGDWHAAAQQHLFVLDPGRTKEDMRRFLSRGLKFFDPD